MFDIVTSLIAAIIIFVAAGTSYVRWRVTRLPILGWLVASTLIIGGLYVVFVYNAVVGLPNAPFRYGLRFAHIFHFAMLVWLQIVKTRADQAATQHANKVIRGNGHG